MPLVKAQCTNCGGALDVDDSKDAAICPFCNTPFIVQKAINQYSVNNVITAQNVFIQGHVGSEFDVAGGVLKAYYGNDPDVIIPDVVKKIAAKAFEGQMIEGIRCNRGLLEIEKDAFLNCTNLRRIKFDPELQKMNMSFAGCDKLETIYVPTKLLGRVDFSFGLVSFNDDNGIPQRLSGECKRLVSIFVDGKKLDKDDPRLEYFITTPIGFDYVRRKKTEETMFQEETLIRSRMMSGVCMYCGGQFGGLITQKCKNCGREKNY